MFVCFFKKKATSYKQIVIPLVLKGNKLRRYSFGKTLEKMPTSIV